MSIEAKLEALTRARRAQTAHPGYIRWEGGQITGVACKLCGQPISLNGGTLPAYREVELSFDDGSKHISPLCAPCLGKGLTAPVLEAIYCDDMKILAIEEEIVGGAMRWEMWKDRTPISYRSL